MRPFRLSRLAAAVGAALALVVTMASPAHAAVVNYVALGDSYSSGVGTGTYIASSYGCKRSTKAYPYLWAVAHAPNSFSFQACSGAKTTDVSANQLGTLSTATTLVSISIGGNDVGFANIMVDCNLYSNTTCVNEINAAENTARNYLPGWLNTLFYKIRNRAPYAKVVVLSYPRFYDLSAWYCPGLSSTKRTKINEGADVLDSVVSAAATRYGFRFADVRASFAAGHEICDYGSWLHSVDWGNLGESYHPTSSGQSGGYLPAFSAKTA